MKKVVPGNLGPVMHKQEFESDCEHEPDQANGQCPTGCLKGPIKAKPPGIKKEEGDSYQTGKLMGW